MPPVPPITSADPNSFLALGMQSALQSPQTTAAKLRFAKYLSGNSFNVVPAVVDLREGGDGLDFGTTYKQQEKVQGTLRFYLRPEIGGQFFQLLPGGATAQAVGSTTIPASQMFHDNHASHPYATIVVQHPGSTLAQILSDIRFTGFTLEGRTGMPHLITAPFTAISFGASVAAFTPTYFAPPDDFFLFHSNPSYVIDGQADSTIESFTVGFQLGTEELQAQGVGLDDIAVLSRVIDVSVTRRYQSPSQWQKIAYGAAGNVSPTYSVATGSLSIFNTNGQSGANLRSFLMNLGLLSYRYDNLSDLDPDGVTVRETLSARALHTATSAITIQMANGHGSAYAS